ncbi:MAG: sigma 54-interacting transcriptional regulator [Deltaproteobacteria bacterium]|nr:sigma 54-interacting transcriptional regulator [Deltaproteobacteria bacterium]
MVDSTLAASSSGDPADAIPRWVLTLACSPLPSAVGAAVVIAPGTAIELGRHTDEFGPDALGGGRVSREHACIEVAADGTCTVEDRGSHNGTRVNGQRIRVASLRRNDLVGLGNVLLHVDRHAASTAPDDLDRRDRELHEVAAQAEAVLLRGATGTGKDWCARRLHALRGETRPWVVVDCAALREDAVDPALLGAAGRPGMFAQAQGGTLYLDGIDRASSRLQALVLGVLKHSQFHAGDEPQPRPFEAFIVASAADGDAPGTLDDALAARLGHWTLRLPPLANRRREIPGLAAQIVRDELGRDRALHPRLVRDLLQAEYPGNLHDLRTRLARALREAGPEDPVPAPALAPPAPSPSSPSLGPRCQVDAQGQWFHPDGEARVELLHRPVLMRLLAALVASHVQSTGGVLTPEQLVAAGWPDERLGRRVGVNRLYVAVSTLRKLGLGSMVERTRSGYRFAAEARVRVVVDGS